MDAIEQALARTQKREERKARMVLTVPKPIEVPKAKPTASSNDAVIRISVTYPGGVHELAYIKKNVAANVPPSRMTRNEFNKMFLQGFVPLLGGVDEFPCGG